MFNSEMFSRVVLSLFVFNARQRDFYDRAYERDLLSNLELSVIRSFVFRRFYRYFPLRDDGFCKSLRNIFVFGIWQLASVLAKSISFRY